MMGLEKEERKKIRKIRRVIRFDRIFHKQFYSYDDGQVMDIANYEKSGVSYSVIQINTDCATSNYLVFLFIHTRYGVLTQQLAKFFDNAKSARHYFKELQHDIKNHSNKEIIDWCYQELSHFPRHNIFTRFLSMSFHIW